MIIIQNQLQIQKSELKIIDVDINLRKRSVGTSKMSFKIIFLIIIIIIRKLFRKLNIFI